MNEITLTRTVPVDAQRAFRAWTDPAVLATWWWPQLPDTTYELDAREGGRYRIQSPVAGIGVSGEFLAVQPPEVLRFSWTWLDDGRPELLDGAPLVDTIEVTFRSLPGDSPRTEVTVRHATPGPASMAAYEQGWNDVLDRLPTA